MGKQKKVKQELWPDGTPIPAWFSDTTRVDISGLKRYVVTDYGVDGYSNEVQTARLQAEAATLRQSLQQARQRYAKASPDERRQMAPQLLSDERQLEQLLLDIKQKAKQERNRAQ